MKVLFIWEQFDQPLELYEVVSPLAEKVVLCDRQYINDSDLADDAAIHEFHDTHIWREGEPERAPLPKEMTAITGAEACGPYDRIVVAGFLP